MTKVLLADDHAIIRDGVKEILADTDDLVVAGEAANGNDVLRLVNEQKWDILVLDISMPGKNGLELIKLVRNINPRLPILIFSMHQEEQYALRALHAGASGYLTKESDGEVLVAVIRKVAGGGIHVSEKVAAMLARERMPLIDELPHTRLSDREFQIFEKIIGGSRLTDIANELNLSIKTVSTHKSRILQKMSMASETDLVRYAIAKGLLNPAE
jgi:two-component system invasion response regulator UvrY